MLSGADAQLIKDLFSQIGMTIDQIYQVNVAAQQALVIAPIISLIVTIIIILTCITVVYIVDRKFGGRNDLDGIVWFAFCICLFVGGCCIVWTLTCGQDIVLRWYAPEYMAMRDTIEQISYIIR